MMNVVFVNFKKDMARYIDLVLLQDTDVIHPHFVPLSDDVVDVVSELAPSVIVCGFDYGAEVRDTPDLYFILNIWKEKFKEKMMVIFAQESAKLPDDVEKDPNIVVIDSWMEQKPMGKVFENLAHESIRAPQNI